MKKTFAITTLSILALVLTACGALPGAPVPGSSNDASQSSTMPASSPNPPAGTGPSALQLAAGMIKLDGTSNAVTAQQAAQLLPLWQELQTIENMPVAAGSPPATPQVSSQGTPNPPFGRRDPATMQKMASQIVLIQNAMTPAQIQAITDMNLSRQDIFTVFQSAGIQMGGFGPGGGFGQNDGTFTPPNGTPRAYGTPGAFQGGAGFGQGGGRQGFGNFMPSSVVDGIVQYLQKKAGP